MATLRVALGAGAAASEESGSVARELRTSVVPSISDAGGDAGGCSAS